MSEEKQDLSLTDLSVTVRTAKGNTEAHIREDQAEATADVAAVLEVIGRRLYEPAFGVDELARECPLDAEAVWRFNLQTGLHPRAYIDRRRLDTAFELVRHSGLRVSEIAPSVGFRNAESFTKWFKRRTGKAPLKLRSAPSVRPMRKLSGWAACRKALMLESTNEECVTFWESLIAYVESVLHRSGQRVEEEA